MTLSIGFEGREHPGGGGGCLGCVTFSGEQKKKKTSDPCNFCGRKYHVNERGQMQMVRQGKQEGRKYVTVQYNDTTQSGSSESTHRRRSMRFTSSKTQEQGRRFEVNIGRDQNNPAPPPYPHIQIHALAQKSLHYSWGCHMTIVFLTAGPADKNGWYFCSFSSMTL
uniref:Uncharacterized protein n=1 Tax=Paramormyrops kingsleyae TaxID=1676925 RepID=A0A3B3QLW1_9TELE